MYQNIYVDKKNNIIHLWDDGKTGNSRYVTVPYRPYAYRKREGGMYRSIYGDELEKVYKFSPKDPSLFESDVPAETRILIDAYEDSDEPSEGHRVVYLDIEVSTEGGFPNVEEADKEITAIAIYDSCTSKYTAFILDKEQKLQDFVKENVEVRSFTDEDSLLMHFLTKWEEIQPTISTGWNSDNFDMPYLFRRMKNIIGPNNAKRLSPIQVAYINDWNKKVIVAGVTHLDYMTLYKKLNIKQEASYALGAIGKKIVGMEKIAYKGSLDDLYKADINKYIEYNLNDVQIIVALEKKLQFIELARAICHKGHVPYEWYEMSSRFIEGAILMYLRRKGQVAKNKSLDGRDEYETQMEDNEQGFEGAYVKAPTPGRYDWVFDLDLTSMYPNIIISLNLSPETKVAVINKIEYDDSYVEDRTKEIREDYENLGDSAQKKTPFTQYLEQRLYAFNARLFAQDKIGKYHVGSTVYTNDEFKQLVTQSNLSVASNGVMCKKDKTGVIPEILVKWFDERKDLRKLAKKHADLKEWEKYEFYDGRQKVQKVLLNSIYGVLGLPIFRFYDKDNASAVTITGQDIIKSTGKAINECFKRSLNEKEGDWVIYTDTDSCFASALPIIKKNMPDIDLNDEKAMTEAILKVTGDVQSFVNKFYDVMAKRYFNIEKHRFDAKQEVIAKTSFWLAKKRYAQFIINKAGIECDEMEVKGIDVVRTSFPIRFRKFMQKFLDDMLRKLPKDQIDASILEFKDKMSTYPVIEIAKNTSVKFKSQNGDNDYNPKTRHPFQFMDCTPAQAKAALAYNDLLKTWKLDKDVPEIFHGQKIKWVYLKQNQYGIEGIAMKADGTDPDRIMEFIEQYVDRNAMYEQELKGKLLDFYNVLNWSYPNETDVKLEEFFSF
jgi:DNA polymerase elongation subunit (family B)